MAKLVKNLSMGIIQNDIKLTMPHNLAAISTRRVITINGKHIPPPPPRKVILERLAKLPPKPTSVLVERWMPYAANKTKRRVIFQRPPPDPIVLQQKNSIIQWHQPSILVSPQVKSLGVVKTEPREYVRRYGAQLKPTCALPKFIRDLRADQFLISNQLYNPFRSMAQRDMCLTNKNAFSVTINKATPISTISTPISKLIIR